ncbi:MAG TPA: pyridoxal 5'-phosphate synthase glutaminase subunit PdxT [Chloroflexia bacterium]|nr:pyridoxal 5'-phosphate synthase glutaminase subunit PdxT [Chloroflexia bacterium]
MHTDNLNKAPKIGVLALQGAFIEHIKVLKELGADAREVRLPEDLEGLDGLIIPGGESTAIGKLMTNWGLTEPIKEMAQSGKPVWGTCAGMILLARDIGGLKQPLLGLMDIKVKRNAFGSQLDSFEADLSVPAFHQELAEDAAERAEPFRGVFIRAPYIEQVGPETEELASLEGEDAVKAKSALEGETGKIIVAARQNNLLATAFHPELTEDHRFHRLFLKMVEKGQ